MADETKQRVRKQLGTLADFRGTFDDVARMVREERDYYASRFPDATDVRISSVGECDVCGAAWLVVTGECEESDADVIARILRANRKREERHKQYEKLKAEFESSPQAEGGR